MAERRMFSKEIIDSDAFLDMPVSTQNLYFHLGMRADDDGFVNSPNKIMATCKASKNDMDLLIVKSFIISFGSGVVVIKHWRINNYLRADRYKPTRYQEEYDQLDVKNNDSYRLRDVGIPLVDTSGIPLVDAGKVRLDENSLDESSIGESPADEPPHTPAKRFCKPTLDEVVAYCLERKNKVDAQRFIDFYESKGWMVGKTSMRDWKASVRTWEKSDKPTASKTGIDYQAEAAGWKK